MEGGREQGTRRQHRPWPADSEVCMAAVDEVFAAHGVTACGEPIGRGDADE
jgi:hypothetical protein